MNTRPVRLPPWAAGASPTMSRRAAGSPNPGSGRPQYVSPACRATFSRATSSRHATRRGHARQATISAVNAASPASREVGLDRSLTVASVPAGGEGRRPNED